MGYCIRQDYDIFNRFLHELQMIYVPYLTQLHLCYLLKGTLERTINFANYEICVK